MIKKILGYVAGIGASAFALALYALPAGAQTTTVGFLDDAGETISGNVVDGLWAIAPWVLVVLGVFLALGIGLTVMVRYFRRFAK